MFRIIRPQVVMLIFVLGLVLQGCGGAPAAAPQAQQPSLAATSAPSSGLSDSAAAATSTSGASASAGSAETTTVKVAILPFISFAPFLIAQEEGFFKEQGLNVEFVRFTTQNELIPALTAGQIDVAAGLLSAGLFNTIVKGGAIKIVADKGYIDPAGCANIALVARKDLATAGGAMTGDQLRNLKVAHVRGSWLDYYATKVLATVGLTLDDLQVITLPSPSVPEAMNTKQIDLVLNNEPWITRLLQNGHVAILTPVQQLLPDSQSAVTLYGPGLLKNPDAGNRFMVAYLKAVRQYNAGKTDRNIAILAKEIKLDPALLKAMCWPTLRDDGSINTASVQDFQSWSIAGKLIDEPVPEATYWDGSFIAYANKQLGASTK